LASLPGFKACNATYSPCLPFICAAWKKVRKKPSKPRFINVVGGSTSPAVVLAWLN
jgi:hypothetical protein